MTQEDKELAIRLAKPKLRGTPSSHLVYEIQDASQAIETEENENMRFQHRVYMNHCLNELERRCRMKLTGVQATNQNLIQSIKDALPVEDVIEWYTQVFFRQNKWFFRCTVHGEDRNPSGVIYPEDKKWWCFGCNKGGDVFDAVMHFERVEMPEAMRKLANYLGLDATLPKTEREKSLKEEVEELSQSLGEHIYHSTKKKHSDEPF